MTFVEIIDLLETMASRADRIRQEMAQWMSYGDDSLARQRHTNRAIADLDDMGFQLRTAKRYLLDGRTTERVALNTICDRTSERLRTKHDLTTAIDTIGSIAAEALAVTPREAEPNDA